MNGQLAKNATTSGNNDEAGGDWSVVGTEVAPGSLSEMKKIYLKPSDSESEKWLDDCPQKIIDDATNDTTTKYAIVVRQKKSSTPERLLETHSVLIQSPSLQNALCDYVFQGYPGVVCIQSRLIFMAPFQPFVHRWDNYKRLKRRRNLSDITKQQISLLYDLMVEEIKPLLELYQIYITRRIIPYKDLWIIFNPGETSYYDNRYDKEKYFHLQYWSVDWNGSFFGQVMGETKIHQYEGFSEVESFPLYPLSMDEQEDEIRAALISRGKKFEMLAGYHYKRYTGPAITWGPDNKEQKVYQSGRVIVDAASFDRYSPGRGAFVTQRKKSQPVGGHKIESDGLLDAKFDFSGNKLSTYQQMLCNHSVRGYSPQTNIWLGLAVDLISDIEWKMGALESLVLPQAPKDLIVAISKSHNISGEDFDDFIEGKGQGVIILLSGPPGTGKTLTAEAVAEDMRVPLMPVSVASLVGSSDSLERGLTKMFELASHWNAVLLLDECDVFLVARSPDRISQNNTVSVFLRTLEYYKGILFMTTNRHQAIDEAFASRVHLSLEYPYLAQASRRQIWKNLLKTSLKHHELSETQVDELAQLDVNGRQIKNILRMAQLLASRAGEHVQKKFIDTILSIKEQPMVPDDALLQAPPPPESSTSATEQQTATNSTKTHI
ncbi:hypothetical protein FE257_000838 [Aspergillus nanangensis]|uniref:AAA+ ATPase domain-containing protein n=1 Tax=Aspergillus nanangensis TaxID=2582783 RepID=A0AAD4CEM6_ASPNN|nr:hypothetical protein FE257_000838 [Aspergillus nanangensis]